MQSEGNLLTVDGLYGVTFTKMGKPHKEFRGSLIPLPVWSYFLILFQSLFLCSTSLTLLSLDASYLKIMAQETHFPSPSKVTPLLL